MKILRFVLNSAANRDMLGTLAVLGLLTLSSVRGIAQEPAKQVMLALEDQWERPTDVKQYRGHVLVLLYGDRASQTSNKALGERLHVHFHPTARGLPPAQASRAPVRPLPGIAEGQTSPGVYVVPVACIGSVPNAVKGLIRSQFRSASPEVAVWLDFADTMKQTFGLTPGVTNLLVIDGSGRLRMRVQGTIDAATYDRLVRTIENLRYEAVQSR